MRLRGNGTQAMKRRRKVVYGDTQREVLEKRTSCTFAARSFG